VRKISSLVWSSLTWSVVCNPASSSPPQEKDTIHMRCPYSASYSVASDIRACCAGGFPHTGCLGLTSSYLAGPPEILGPFPSFTSTPILYQCSDIWVGGRDVTEYGSKKALSLACTSKRYFGPVVDGWIYPSMTH
jgi:hypothetical protein